MRWRILTVGLSLLWFLASMPQPSMAEVQGTTDESVAVVGYARQEKFFGQEPPGRTPRVFAPGIVSLPGFREMYCSLSPDNSEFFFHREGQLLIWRSGDKRGEAMTQLKFEGRFIHPYCTPDGRSLVLRRLPEDDNPSPDHSATWIVDRTNDGWGEPRFLHPGYCLTWDVNGQAFFTSDIRPNADIMAMQFVDGRFTELQAVEGGVNTKYLEGHSSVSADGSVLLFDSDRPGGYGKTDIYVSFRQADGSWGEPKNLGPKVNNKQVSGMAFMTADHRFIFYTARETENSSFDIWWVGAEILDGLRSDQRRPAGTKSHRDCNMH